MQTASYQSGEIEEIGLVGLFSLLDGSCRAGDVSCGAFSVTNFPGLITYRASQPRNRPEAASQNAPHPLIPTDIHNHTIKNTGLFILQPSYK